MKIHEWIVWTSYFIVAIAQASVGIYILVREYQYDKQQKEKDLCYPDKKTQDSTQK